MEGEQLGTRQKWREEERKRQCVKDRQEGTKKAFVVLLYMKGVMERLQRAYEQHNIPLFCKARYTIRNAIICPQDSLDLEEKCGVVFEGKCEEC